MNEMWEFLAKVQTEYPNLRAGQIILNAVPEDKVYYVSDEELLVLLKKIYSEVR
jgi:hypothetical protein